jgi:hypothetical protein
MIQFRPHQTGRRTSIGPADDLSDRKSYALTTEAENLTSWLPARSRIVFTLPVDSMNFDIRSLLGRGGARVLKSRQRILNRRHTLTRGIMSGWRHGWRW